MARPPSRSHPGLSQIDTGENTVTFTKLYAAVQAALASKRGAAMAEYALLIALVAVVAITTLTTLGTTISGKFTSITTSLTGG
jgi:pilus assembly protein Flp/PilA